MSLPLSIQELGTSLCCRGEFSVAAVSDVGVWTDFVENLRRWASTSFLAIFNDFSSGLRPGLISAGPLPAEWFELALIAGRTGDGCGLARAVFSFTYLIYFAPEFRLKDRLTVWYALLLRLLNV